MPIYQCNYIGRIVPEKLEDSDVQELIAILRKANERADWAFGLGYYCIHESEEEISLPVFSSFRNKGPYYVGMTAWMPFGHEELLNPLIDVGKVRLEYVGGSGSNGEEWGPEEDSPLAGD